MDIPAAQLIPADAVVFQAAHISRAQLLLDIIDPSVRDEQNPDDRDPELDIYNPENPNQPPYSEAYIARYRAGQRARMDRITTWVKSTLAQIEARKGREMERGFVTHRTLADPRFLDGALDPNDRKIGWCYLGHPETVNTGPVGLARFSTLRAWLSQWSVDDTNADARTCAAKVLAPLLVIENTADDAVPQTHCQMVFDAAASPDKTLVRLEGATHYYAGQPEHLRLATQTLLGWLSERGLFDRHA